MNVKQLEDVLFRLSVTKDESFEKVITILLPRLLLVLTPKNWNNVPLRNKMVQIFSHINKRIKSISNIKLPCKEILKVVLGNTQNGTNKKTLQTADTKQDLGASEEDGDDEDAEVVDAAKNKLPAPNAVRTNFGMVYLTLGLPKLSVLEQGELLPLFVDGVASSSAVEQKYSLLRLMIQILPGVKIPTVIEERHKAFRFLADCDSSTRDFIFEFFLSVLLYKRPPILSNAALQRSKALRATTPTAPGKSAFFQAGQVVYYKATDEAVVVLSLHPDGNNPYYTVLMPNGSEKQTIGNKLAATYLPPGLSLNAKNNILGPSKKDLTQDLLNNYKFGIMRIIGTSIFPTSAILRHIHAGRADSNNIVFEKADEIYRRLQQSRPELENVSLVRSLLEMCIGDLAQAKQSVDYIASPVGKSVTLCVTNALYRIIVIF